MCFAQGTPLLPEWPEWRGQEQSGWCERAREINGACSFMTLCVNKREFGRYFKCNGQKAIGNC